MTLPDVSKFRVSHHCFSFSFTLGALGGGEFHVGEVGWRVDYFRSNSASEGKFGDGDDILNDSLLDILFLNSGQLAELAAKGSNICETRIVIKRRDPLPGNARKSNRFARLDAGQNRRISQDDDLTCPFLTDFLTDFPLAQP